MTIITICLLVSIGQIYLAKGIVAIAMAKEGKGYDNHHPRMQQSKLTGWGARANGAHQNGFEAFSIFSVAILFNLLLEVNFYWLEILAMSFVALRFLYIYLYIADLPKARSTIWTLAFLCTMVMYLLPILP
ncbi:MAPEG family protein [Leptospira mtsangambouensis]|uniref:MAPEG family protein n=1 Tax=Leptospira mtsangambouensis TaxID=2484912 RepID=UPI001EEA1F43|nr:MAPEG family protein [Leptospira mtsangambouensis]MCG6141977.1 MAPEG family protein [Leptospira mtsangambouensis]